MSAQAKQDIKIKPSFVPFVWKGFLVVLLGLVIFGVSFLFESSLSSAGSLLRYAALGLVGLGVLIMLIGVVRRNAFTYLITDSDLVVQRQLLRRSVRRIPFSSISDVQVSQSIVGRLAKYGDIVPVTKSGYGLVRGTEPGENIVAEMADVPNPDKVADLIMSRLRGSKVT
ncbi:MAG: PH domain-containing protein [Candidatus Bathyarchaeia archaeon]